MGHPNPGDRSLVPLPGTMGLLQGTVQPKLAVPTEALAPAATGPFLSSPLPRTALPYLTAPPICSVPRPHCMGFWGVFYKLFLSTHNLYQTQAHCEPAEHRKTFCPLFEKEGFGKCRKQWRLVAL